MGRRLRAAGNDVNTLAAMVALVQAHREQPLAAVVERSRQGAAHGHLRTARHHSPLRMSTAMVAHSLCYHHRYRHSVV